MFSEKDSESHNEALPLSLIIALILSIFVVHLPLIYVLSQEDFSKQRVLKGLQKEKEEQVVMIDLTQSTQLPQRIADIDKPLVEKRPDQASAQALYDSTVKEETVSAKLSKTNIPVGAKTPQNSKLKAQKPKKTARQQTRDQKPETRDQQPQNIQDQLKMILNQQKEKEEKKYAERFETPSKQPSPIFKTNLGSPNGGSTGDYFPDYKIGNRTYLNTMANPNIGYFVELRRKFRFAFNPAPVLRYRVNQISKGSISVVWGLSVDADGNISGLTLIRGSGINDYDREARRTITSSAPFTRPPANLLQTDDKTLHMAWTFVVYL